MSYKLPWMKFYPADWSQDTTPLSLAGRGAWITIVCAMWRSEGRGKLSLPLVGLSRLLGTTEQQAENIVTELTKTGICDNATKNGGNIELICRRIVREEKQRNGNKDRQTKYRENGGGNPSRWNAIRVKILERDEYMCAYCGRRADTVDHVFPKMRGGTEAGNNLVACCKRCNMSKNDRTPKEAGMNFWVGFNQKHLCNTDITPQKQTSEAEAEADKNKNSSSTMMEFDQFWKAYPKKVGKGAARKAFEKWDCKGKITVILKAIEQQRACEQWRKDKGQFIPHPATWLNQERWMDETTVIVARPIVEKRDRDAERFSAIRSIVMSVKQFNANNPKPDDRQRFIDGLSDKYRDIPGALKEALEIVG